jgi:hypothetical protein
MIQGIFNVISDFIDSIRAKIDAYQEKRLIELEHKNEIERITAEKLVNHIEAKADLINSQVKISRSKGV